MRVITGTARGKRLKEPTGSDIRPTTDQVKEAIFNIIQFRVEGSSVLDMFAGTGQLGIEALSRGAAKATFTDSSPEAVKLIRENIERAEVQDRAHVVRTDSFSYLKNGEKYDIVFMDPPYAGDTLEKALEFAAGIDILNKNGIIICESESKKNLDTAVQDYRKLAEYKYGRIKITTFTPKTLEEEKTDENCSLPGEL